MWFQTNASTDFVAVELLLNHFNVDLALCLPTGTFLEIFSIPCLRDFSPTFCLSESCKHTEEITTHTHTHINTHVENTNVTSVSCPTRHFSTESLFCDCQLEWLLLWARAKGVRIANDTLCVYPNHLHGLEFRNLREQQLRCGNCQSNPLSNSMSA